ncbi:hypothetical protein COM97_10245 [Bacillus thuringiensis]|nr:hypothetical protein COM73_02995 [Bacillus thuringiensis]PEF06730.1 hypothetical protein COM97_10245 [Bacillus thuringiensis]PGU28071.1 hypothetical protein COD22_04860 [Bacillus thuringiensis]
MLIISGAEQKTLMKVSLYQSSLCFAFLYKLNKKCRRKVGGKLRIPGLRRICKKEDEKNVYYCECIYKDRIICNNSQSEGKDL